MTSPAPSGQAIGRLWPDGRPARVVVEEGRIAAIEPIAESPPGVWITPGFIDIQTNGRWGVSYSDPALRVEDVIRIVRAHLELGTARLLPTLITASFDATLHGVSTIAAACEADPVVDRMVPGIHLEGPWISSVDGYRGAHPIEHARDPDWSEFEAWQHACGNRIRLVTLAPERPGALPIIRRLVASGVVVALGHTAADGPTLHAAAAAGARLSTHLGNGIASTLPRHPNPIFHQAADPRLFASFIADGHHLDLDTLRVLALAKGPERTILVSDASPLAGLPPGPYGDWTVDPSGKIVVTGTPYLAGSNQGLDVGLSHLALALDCSLEGVLPSVLTLPCHLLGLQLPPLRPGSPSDLALISPQPSTTSRPGFRVTGFPFGDEVAHESGPYGGNGGGGPRNAPRTPDRQRPGAAHDGNEPG